MIVSCPSSGDIDPQLSSDVCRQVVLEAKQGSPYPVLDASEAGIATVRDVLLKIDLRVARPANGSPEISVAVIPTRSDPRSDATDSALPRSRPSLALKFEESNRTAVIEKLIARQLDLTLPWRSRRGGGQY